jgi:ABC-type bacteriocin/lantibiotic exporter with double-glycine peptidase domain
MDPAYGTISKIPIYEFIEKWSGYILRIYPSSGLKRSSGENGYRSYLNALITQSSRELLPALGGTLLCICGGMGTTLLLQQLIDVIIPSGVKTTVIFACLALVLAMGFSLFIGYKASKRIIQCSIKIESTISGHESVRFFCS